VVEESQSAEGGLDVLLRCGAAHSQHRIVVRLTALVLLEHVVIIATPFALVVVGLEEAVVLAAAAGVGLVCV